jgi:hypothetical protein
VNNTNTTAVKILALRGPIVLRFFVMVVILWYQLQTDTSHLKDMKYRIYRADKGIWNIYQLRTKSEEYEAMSEAEKAGEYSRLVFTKEPETLSFVNPFQSTASS